MLFRNLFRRLRRQAPSKGPDTNLNAVLDTVGNPGMIRIVISGDMASGKSRLARAILGQLRPDLRRRVVIHSTLDNPLNHFPGDATPEEY